MSEEKHIIWSNIDLDLDDWYDDLHEEYIDKYIIVWYIWKGGDIRYMAIILKWIKNKYLSINRWYYKNATFTKHYIVLKTEK